MFSSQRVRISALLISSVFLFFYFTRSVITPFFVAIFFAYAFSSLVQRWEKLGISRPLSSALITLSLVSAIFALAILFIPFVANKIYFFFSDIEQIKTQLQVELTSFVKNNVPFLESKITSSTNELFNVASAFLFNKIKDSSALIMNSSFKIVNLIVVFFTFPIIMFFTLKDWNKIKKEAQLLIPKKYYKDASSILSQIDDSLVNYFQGQIKVCLILSVLYSALLLPTGLNYSVLLGLFIGFFAFVPYVGFLAGFIMAIFLSINQFGLSYHAVLVTCLLILGQIIDGNFITPKIIGEKLHLHPVWIVFGLFVCGNLFGVFGAIFALPITACFGVVAKFLINIYKNSGYYKM